MFANKSRYLVPHSNQGWSPGARLGWLAFPLQTQEVLPWEELNRFLCPQGRIDNFFEALGRAWLCNGDHIDPTRYRNSFRSLDISALVFMALLCWRLTIASKGGVFPWFFKLRGSHSALKHIDLNLEESYLSKVLQLVLPRHLHIAWCGCPCLPRNGRWLTSWLVLRDFKMVIGLNNLALVGSQVWWSLLMDV